MFKNKNEHTKLRNLEIVSIFVQFLHSWISFNQLIISDLEDISPDAFLFVYLSSVPNRYTFTCPYCNCPNFDQDGLVEHCTSHHARDARQVVGNALSVCTSRGARVLSLLCFIPGLPHLCLDALGGPWIQERRLFPALEDQTHLLLWHLCRK